MKRALLMVALVILGIPVMPAAADSPSVMRLQLDGPSGAILVYAYDAAGLSFSADVAFTDSDVSPVLYSIILETGKPLHAHTMGFGSGLRDDGKAAFVGMNETIVESPRAPDLSNPSIQHSNRSWTLTETDAFLVLIWSDVEDADWMNVNVTWAPSTTLQVFGGDPYIMGERDFHGIRAGAGTFAGIHLPSNFEIPAEGGDMFGALVYTRDFFASRGYFSMDYGPNHRTLDYNQTGALRGCGVFESGIWVWTTRSDLRLHYEYVGREEEGGLIAMFVARFPANTLPLDIWREITLIPPTC